MTIRNRPDYGVYLLNLANQPAGGYFDVPTIGTRVIMVGAWVGASIVTLNGGYDTLQGGSPTPAIVSLQIGKTPGDPIPLTVGCGVRCDNKFDFLRFSWAPQANIYAIIVVSDDAQGNGLEMVASPSVFQGAVAIEEDGNTAVVTAAGALATASVQGNLPILAGDVFVAAASAGVRLLGGPIGTNCTFVTNPPLNSLPQSGAATAPQVQSGKAGGSFYTSDSVASGSAVQVVAAASNVNGVVIRTANFVNSTNGIHLCYGTSAPTSATTNASILRSGSPSGAELSNEIFIPASNGIWLWSESSSGSADITYDIL